MSEKSADYWKTQYTLADVAREKYQDESKRLAKEVVRLREDAVRQEDFWAERYLAMNRELTRLREELAKLAPGTVDGFGTLGEETG